MASWNALKEHIARTYKYEVLGSGAIKMEFSLDGGRSQVVLVGRASLMDGEEEWAIISSAVGSLDDVNLRLAMREAGGLVCGGMATDGDLVVYRHALPLANLDINEFERPLTLVVTSADRLERTLVGADTF